jgi:predicted HTH domain antitoxin
MSELHMDIVDAINEGLLSFGRIAEIYGVSRADVETIYDEMMAQDMDEYDGQPDEAQEWHDFDPDC